jgi:anti-anti-sigma factor
MGRRHEYGSVLPAPTATGWLEVEQVGHVAVVKFTCRDLLSEEMIQSVGQQLYDVAEWAEIPHIVLNFSLVRRFSSMLLAKLLVMHNKVKAAGGKIALCGISPDFAKVLKITQLDRRFRIYRNEQEALQSL